MLKTNRQKPATMPKPNDAMDLSQNFISRESNKLCDDNFLFHSFSLNNSTPWNDDDLWKTNDVSQANSSFQDLTDIQIKRQKLVRRLPKVDAKGLQWRAFYQLYKETRDLFTPAVNLSRISEALADATSIKKMGGQSLFLLDSFETSMRRIDYVAGVADFGMEQNRNDLLRLKTPRNERRSDDLIEIIHVTCDYADQVRVLGDKARAEDPAVMAHLQSILPPQYIPNWEIAIAGIAMNRKPHLYQALLEVVNPCHF
jgi:hypothetical protein